MATKYCDWATGNDSTGNGTAGNPYKTITKASTEAGTGGEVRVGKSADPAALPTAGTGIAWTKGSANLLGTGTNFDAEVSVYDFLQGPDGNWYEVVTVTDDTHLVLYQVYPGASGTTATPMKLSVTSTGEATASQVVQTVSVNGTSLAAPLVISGGWDLGTETRTGETWFCQLHSTPANRYGYGLRNAKTYVSISHVHFLRYRYGMDISGNMNVYDGINACSCGISGIQNGIATAANRFESIVCCSNASYGIYLTGNNNRFVSPLCSANSASGYGILLSIGTSNVITDPVCDYNSYGIRLDRNYNTKILRASCSHNGTAGVYIKTSGAHNVLNGFSGSGNGADIASDSSDFGDWPVLKGNHFGAAGTNQAWYEYGITSLDTGTPHTAGGQDVRFAATSAAYYISQSFYFQAPSGVAQTLGAYVRASAAYRAAAARDVSASILFNGAVITGPTDITPTADDTYEAKTLNAAAVDIPEDGVLELKISVRGTAGYVYVADLSAVNT